jgi:Tfp pilus assembly protein PilN
MIQINLLPEEYRKRERTSIKVFATVLGAVVVACCSLGYLGHVYFQEYSAVVSDRETHQERLKSVEPHAAHDDKLVKEIKEYEKRSQTLQQHRESPRALDALPRSIHRSREQRGQHPERHMCWFNNLKVTDTRGKSGPQA